MHCRVVASVITRLTAYYALSKPQVLGEFRKLLQADMCLYASLISLALTTMVRSEGSLDGMYDDVTYHKLDNGLRPLPDWVKANKNRRAESTLPYLTAERDVEARAAAYVG